MRRAANQIRDQHERMSPLFAQLSTLLVVGNVRDAQTAGFRLQGALHAHFLLEEQIVFPMLSALSPDRSRELATLLDDHASLESDFAVLTALISAGTLVPARESLSAFTFVLVAHESREENLLRAATGTETSAS